jgi:predicted signal transduction protein with EAL and GGDEF domain
VAPAFASPFSINGQGIRVTASVGIAGTPENGNTADELMRHILGSRQRYRRD